MARWKRQEDGRVGSGGVRPVGFPAGSCGKPQSDGGREANGEKKKTGGFAGPLLLVGSGGSVVVPSPRVLRAASRLRSSSGTGANG